MSDHLSPRISLRRRPVPIARAAGTSHDDPATAARSLVTSGSSTETSSARRGRGGWAPLAGFDGISPHRTAWPNACVRTRWVFSTVPADSGGGGGAGGDPLRGGRGAGPGVVGWGGG